MTTRINKYLADHQYSSRREADVLIQKGLVFINGQKAGLGDQVKESDTVEVRGVSSAKKAYYAYYKPTGLVTVNAQKEEKEILDVVKFPEKVYPVGRLDKESEGLIIFTNDGRVTTALLGPKEKTEKEYEVTVDKPITHQFLVHIQNGIDIGAVGKTRHYKTKKTKARRTSKESFDIVLTEGKNRQIRRMCGAEGYEVLKLRRFRIGNIALGNLKEGHFRTLEKEEVKDILDFLV